MSVEPVNILVIQISEQERKAPVPTLGTMPKGVADLLWQNLAPAEADRARRICRGTLASEQSAEAQIRIGFRYEIDLLFTWMESNFQTDVSDCKQRLEFLISDLTLPSEKKIREKIHAELVLLFLSLSDEDLAKTDSIDALPLRRLREEMLSSIWMVTAAKEARVSGPFSTRVQNLMTICGLLVEQKRFDEAIQICNMLPSIKVSLHPSSARASVLLEIVKGLCLAGLYAKASGVVDKMPDIDVCEKKEFRAYIFSKEHPFKYKFLMLLSIFKSLLKSFFNDVLIDHPISIIIAFLIFIFSLLKKNNQAG